MSRCFVEFSLDVVVHVGEGLTRGGVRPPAPGGQAAAGTGTEGGLVSVGRLQGEVQVASRQASTAAFHLRAMHLHAVLAGPRIMVTAGWDGGDLDAGAVKQPGGRLQGVVYSPSGDSAAGFISTGTLQFCGRDKCRRVLLQVRYRLVTNRRLRQANIEEVAVIIKANIYSRNKDDIIKYSSHRYTDNLSVAPPATLLHDLILQESNSDS